MLALLAPGVGMGASASAVAESPSLMALMWVGKCLLI